MEMDTRNFRMDAIIREGISLVKWKEMGNMFGQMAKFIRENG
jgi:hypothetical protein